MIDSNPARQEAPSCTDLNFTPKRRRQLVDPIGRLTACLEAGCTQSSTAGSRGRRKSRGKPICCAAGFQEASRGCQRGARSMEKGETLTQKNTLFTLQFG